MSLNYIRRGAGKPLLLLHGLGSSLKAWDLVIDELATQRDVIAVDLPGFGQSPALLGEVSISTLADVVTDFLSQHQLLGIDAVGNSMGGRLVLELARRGQVVGSVVSLDPGGFWQGWQVAYFYHSVRLSAQLSSLIQPILPPLVSNPVSRTLLFAQFSAHPWTIPAPVALNEFREFLPTPSFTKLLDSLAHGPPQQGAPLGSIPNLVIGWGRQDRICPPSQAKRALALFPDAQLHWFSNCGHVPQLDVPAETVALILAVTEGRYEPQTPVSTETKESEVTENVFIGVGVAVLLVGLFLTFGLKR
ncbi:MULTISPECIES: alpha/beta fold hydrolase [Spirosoma]|uniref:Alpha/beta fold hydrolase n=1 Tax=Spirosoma liriopis TaxID=2937440 RepID=A0ABT0HTL0_9BACT|nr:MULTISPECIES: alpha/beta fold hydrolase [Spirosoma]MCK8495524.1 alpha/beta fold hydrolase [Spirosoma liriopis]UHG94536.1 alpha/beta fold hydrolase [Spirosoma oryzicola]